MKKTIILLIASLFLSVVPTSASAEPSREPDVGAVLAPLKKGHIAPFTGVLMSPKATATIIAELATFAQRVQIEVDRAKAEAAAKAEFDLNEQKAKAEADRKIAAAQVEEQKKRIDALNAALKKSQDERPNTTLWTGLGFGAGVAVTVLTVFAVGSATK